MKNKLYQFFCEICGWKKITDGSNITLTEIKTSPIPGGVPKYNDAKKEIVNPKTQKQIKKYKCPKCGRGIRAKPIGNPQEEIDQKNDLQDRIKKRIENDEKERLKQIERQRKKQDRIAGDKASFEGREI